jgi:8-oxo-dGTP pyrophosphatase MutT (NUDIX family)
MSNGLIQVVAGAHIKYVDNIPFILLGLKPSGIWEFPGGKVENQESHSETMEREWIEELGVMVECEHEHFGHARSGAYEVWFYEVDIKQDEYQDGEPMSQEHVDVMYFRLDEVDGIEMNVINKTMLSKLINKYV